MIMSHLVITLHKPGITSPIVGTMKLQHLDEAAIGRDPVESYRVPALFRRRGMRGRASPVA